ncbi:MAG: hypothetical protein KDK08_27910 [Rhizobiaceae bacterium]|nr:hypothetical protein [Rhizobiaceae bacterium]
MTPIINLGAERARRDGPDAEFVRKDEFGRTLYCFITTYQDGEACFSLDLWAYDFADAERRVCNIKASLELAGQVFERSS